MQIKHLPLLTALAALPAFAHVSDTGMDYTRYRDHNGASAGGAPGGAAFR